MEEIQLKVHFFGGVAPVPALHMQEEVIIYKQEL